MCVHRYSSTYLASFKQLAISATIIDKFCAISRNDVHTYDTLEKLKAFKDIHMECMLILSLYLHEENHNEVARQHIAMAKSISGGDHGKALSAFKHASKHFGSGDDDEQEILDEMS